MIPPKGNGSGFYVPGFLVRRRDLPEEGARVVGALLFREYTEPDREPTLLELATAHGVLLLRIFYVLGELEAKGLVVWRPGRAWHVCLPERRIRQVLDLMRADGVEVVEPDSPEADPPEDAP